MQQTDGRNINPKGKTTHSTQRGRTIPSIPLSENRAPHTKSSKKLPGFFLGGGEGNALLFSLSLMRGPFPSLPLATVPAATKAGEASVIGMSDNLITTTVRREREKRGGLNRWRHPSFETHPFLPSFPPCSGSPNDFFSSPRGEGKRQRMSGGGGASFFGGCFAGGAQQRFFPILFLWTLGVCVCKSGPGETQFVPPAVTETPRSMSVRWVGGEGPNVRRVGCGQENGR